MNVTRKDATIQNVGSDDDFPGSFEVVLSTSAKDRDGDELAAEDWKQPLPDHITFDTDHGMSVATTVGSGVPSIEDGKLLVRGTYSSLSRAQDTRTLVKEGHIRTTSVAFMTEKAATKDGKTKTVRELLNGAFVAIPSNREAVVLAAKSITEEVKAGSRNSTADMARIQAIHDHALALGATSPDDTAAASGATGGKSVDDQILALAIQIKELAEQPVEVSINGHVIHNPADVAVIVKTPDDDDDTDDDAADDDDSADDDTDQEDSNEPDNAPTAEKSGHRSIDKAPIAETPIDDAGIDLLNRLTVIKTAAAIVG